MAASVLVVCVMGYTDDSAGRSPPVSGKHMFQLCVLQRGWDVLMNDIAQFLAKVSSA